MLVEISVLNAPSLISLSFESFNRLRTLLVTYLYLVLGA